MKKKKKKKAFLPDLEAALGESNATNENDAGANDGDFDDLGLENLGKKKKKKKPFNLDDLENNLPSTDTDDKKDDASNDAAGNDGAIIEDDYGLDLDFSKTKKKRKKKKELDELVSEKTVEEQEQQILSENGMTLMVS